jgi:hypothetical protein
MSLYNFYVLKVFNINYIFNHLTYLIQYKLIIELI